MAVSFKQSTTPSGEQVPHGASFVVVRVLGTALLLLALGKLPGGDPEVEWDPAQSGSRVALRTEGAVAFTVEGKEIDPTLLKSGQKEVGPENLVKCGCITRDGSKRVRVRASMGGWQTDSPELDVPSLGRPQVAYDVIDFVPVATISYGVRPQSVSQELICKSARRLAPVDSSDGSSRITFQVPVGVSDCDIEFEFGMFRETVNVLPCPDWVLIKTVGGQRWRPSFGPTGWELHALSRERSWLVRMAKRDVGFEATWVLTACFDRRAVWSIGFSPLIKVDVEPDLQRLKWIVEDPLKEGVEIPNGSLEARFQADSFSESVGCHEVVASVKVSAERVSFGLLVAGRDSVLSVSREQFTAASIGLCLWMERGSMVLRGFR